MKIVMTFSKALGDCGNYMETIPVEYLSPEAARTAFQTSALAARAQCLEDFTFCGKEFDTFEFFNAGKLIPVYFMTVDEWFGQL